MCGIVGIISFNAGGLYLKDQELFKEMLIINSLRGSDSTGAFGGRLSGQADFCKAEGNPYTFINHPEAKQFFHKIYAKYHYIVGHGRMATRGAINGENAHPFQMGHITMVHNGTVKQTSKIDVIKHTVDSRAICAALAENEDPVDVLEDIDGAFTLVWHDAIKGTLNFARNKERPLFIATNEKEKRVYFASEKNMLITACARNNIVFDNIISLPENTVIEYSYKGDTKPKQTIFRDRKDVKWASMKTDNVVQWTPPTTTHRPNNTSGRIIKVTSQTTKRVINVDDFVYFNIKDVSVIPTVGSPHIRAYGELMGFPEAEVYLAIKGELSQIAEKATWKARVASITTHPDSRHQKGKTYMFYVTEGVQVCAA